MTRMHLHAPAVLVLLMGLGVVPAPAQAPAPPGMFPGTGPRDFTGAYTISDRASSAPQTSSRSCIPDFIAGIGTPGPTHVVTGQNVIVIAHPESRSVRRIYLGGQHPKDLEPTVHGHSIGRWDGDTLVVETIGLKSGRTVVERIRKVEGGRQVEATVDGRASLANWRPDLAWVEGTCDDSRNRNK